MEERKFPLRHIERWSPLLRFAQRCNEILSDKFGIRIVLSQNIVAHVSLPHRLIYFQRLLDLIGNRPGDVVECGVFEGGSLLVLALLNKYSAVKRHIWGFDSFEGLPSPSQHDLDRPTAIAKPGMFAAGESRVWRNLSNVGFDASVKNDVTLVKGWFSETLPNYRGAIALLHIDADLHESTKYVLEALWSKVIVGGVVAFDDYEDLIDWPGVRRAIDEFLKPLIEYGQAAFHHDSLIGRYYAVKLG